MWPCSVVSASGWRMIGRVAIRDEHCQMRILYVSYDGALEPLGESQVVSYLERLSTDYAITLVSFEKSGDLVDGGRVDVLRRRLAATGIRWYPLRYHRWPPVLS